jgi:hypothetical protein
MNANAPRFEILRQHLHEHGWHCVGGWAVHPLLGKYGLLSALVMNAEAAAAMAMSELGAVHGSLWSGEPGVAEC